MTRNVRPVGLFLFGFVLTGLYWPGISGAATSPRWALLIAVAGSILFVGNALRPTLAHVAGAAFVVWSLLTIKWSASPFDSIDAAWKLVTLACVFCIGAELETLRSFFRGAAIGIGISSVIAIMQRAGYPVMAGLPLDYTSGLFAGASMLAEAAALVAAGLIAAGDWRWAVLAAPALVLPIERAPLLAFAVACVAMLERRSRRLAALVIVVALIVGAVITVAREGRFDSVNERFTVWRATIEASTLTGKGIGSFADVDIAPQPIAGFRTDHAHNEILEAAFETGWIGALLLAVFLVVAASAAPLSAEGIVLLALLVEGCFGFPFHEPVTGSLGAMCAGYCARALPRLGRAPAHGRALLRKRLDARA